MIPKSFFHHIKGSSPGWTYMSLYRLLFSRTRAKSHAIFWFKHLSLRLFSTLCGNLSQGSLQAAPYHTRLPSPWTLLGCHPHHGLHWLVQCHFWWRFLPGLSGAHTWQVSTWHVVPHLIISPQMGTSFTERFAPCVLFSPASNLLTDFQLSDLQAAGDPKASFGKSRLRIGVAAAGWGWDVSRQQGPWELLSWHLQVELACVVLEVSLGTALFLDNVFQKGGPVHNTRLLYTAWLLVAIPWKIWSFRRRKSCFAVF